MSSMSGFSVWWCWNVRSQPPGSEHDPRPDPTPSRPVIAPSSPTPRRQLPRQEACKVTPSIVKASASSAHKEVSIDFAG